MPYNPKNVTPKAIADSFVAELRDWIKDPRLMDGAYSGLNATQAWAKMCADNAAETDPHVCHSHDWCDANMAMDAAFRAHGLNPLPRGQAAKESAASLWCAAWEAAMPAIGRVK